MIETLELANSTEDPARREQLLTYVFVGGGYAGLEALAELQDFAADAMERYPRARLHGMRWILVEATDRVLPEIDRKLADYAVRELRGRGIEVRLGTTLESVEANAATLSTGETVADQDRRLDRRGDARTRAWRTCRCRSTSAAGSSVDDHLRVQGQDGVWAIGDCAAVPDRRGGLAPPTAQHGIRQAQPGGARTSPPPCAGCRRRPTATRAARRSSTSAATRPSGRIGTPHLLAASSPGGWPAPTT